MTAPQHPPEWYVGMDEDTIRRARLSDANLQGIIDGRRRAATKLIARDQSYARQVAVNTAPLLGDKYRGWVPVGLVIPNIPPPSVIGGAVFHGEGFPPRPEDVEGALPGAWYMDDLTGNLYKLED